MCDNEDVVHIRFSVPLEHKHHGRKSKGFGLETFVDLSAGTATPISESLFRNFGLEISFFEGISGAADPGRGTLMFVLDVHHSNSTFFDRNTFDCRVATRKYVEEGGVQSLEQGLTAIFFFAIHQ